MERFHTLVFVAGIGCFAIAFVLSMVFPWMTLGEYHGMEFKTLAMLSEEPAAEFVEFSERYPEAFQEAYGEVSPESYGEALQRGRDLYVGQACFHCHSQYVRPVANEAQRFGPVATASEYQNALNQPHLWGTRRVGPDLSRVGGKYTNDWHVAHMIQPKNVLPDSVMPAYSFWFDDVGVPNRDGMAVITYLQWLGTDRREGGE
ncbi:MAG: cbb3-type cytochrome c oxidase subunit II [Planctomycetota bacterium]